MGSGDRAHTLDGLCRLLLFMRDFFGELYFAFTETSRVHLIFETPRIMHLDSHLTSMPVAAAHVRQPLRALYGQFGRRTDHHPSRRGDPAELWVGALRTPPLRVTVVPRYCLSSHPPGLHDKLWGLARLVWCDRPGKSLQHSASPAIYRKHVYHNISHDFNTSPRAPNLVILDICLRCGSCTCAGTQQTPPQL